MMEHTKSCLMGYDLPLDRVPSDIDSRVAFTLGVWAKARGLGRPSRLSEGFGALVDELPQELSPDERAVWAVGYLYALVAGPQPTAVRAIRDGVLGTVYEVDEVGGAKVGYVVIGAGMRVIPVRVYVR
jgi:hypothetical protein